MTDTSFLKRDNLLSLNYIIREIESESASTIANKSLALIILDENDEFSVEESEDRQVVVIDLDLEDEKLTGKEKEDNRLLSKLHLPTKIGLFGVFLAKFLDHMYTYALKIWQEKHLKIPNFFRQSEF